MENLGKKLEQARLSKNLSLDEVHKITKINKNYLIALETSNVKAFPAEVYYKNFLRRYATYLGLDGQAFLQEYNNLKQEKQPRSENKKIFAKTKNNNKKWFLPAVFFILILLLIFMNYLIKTDAQRTENEIDNLINANNISFTKGDTKEEIISKQAPDNLQAEQQPEQKQDNSIQSQPVEQTKPIVVVTEKPVEPQQNNINNNNNIVVEKKQKLVVKANSDTWVDISADGKNKYTGFLFTGNQNTFYATNLFNIKIGDVNGVEVFFNDSPIDILSGADENNVNTLELKK